MSRTLLARLAVAVAALAVAAVAFRKVSRPAFDEAGFLRGCARSCEAQWRKGAADPSLPAHGMSEQAVTGLCACNCETVLRSLDPALRDALRSPPGARNPPAGELATRLTELAARATEQCAPRFLPGTGDRGRAPAGR
jgi:hypothetical protein